MNGFDFLPFGEQVRQFRERRQPKVSQQALANALGVDRQTIVAWEGGKYLPKDRTRVMELAERLHLDEQETDLFLRAALLDPRPPWYVPYPRNPFFTGRDQELERLHGQLHQRQTAVVGQTQSISGLGGIGKTQLAVEYAYRYHDEYHYVLWARAESVEALTSSFAEIARLLDLPEKDSQEQEITIQAVKRWLQRQRGWLLILDNADTPDLLPAFLPSTVGGHLLITTRAADLSAQISGLTHPLVVEIFSGEQGALFLLHRSGLLALSASIDQAEASTRQLALAIAHELGGLPLALDQAGAYLKATGSSLTAYQHIYQQHRAQLLKERRGVEHPESVATTWNISFRMVEQQNPAAADLLRLCAFLAPDAIPEEILTEGVEELGSILAPVAADPFLLGEAIESLQAYSLIARNPHAHTLTAHRLVQAVLRDSMPAEIQRHWMQLAVHAVKAASPQKPDFTSWPILERLLPHMLTCANWIEQVPLTTPTAANLLDQAGSYLHVRARHGEAEPLLKRSLAIRKQQLGAMHPHTAASFTNLAELYKTQGKYGEAEPLLKRALVIWEQQLGDHHPDTAVSFNNLAELYQAQGKYGEAEPLLKRSLAIREQQLGAMHPDTATGLNNLALLYYVQGRYREAEPLYRRALAICEQELGAMHPDTATGLNNLAGLYRAQGRYGEAEPLYRRALAIREQQLGTNHPVTGTSLNNLAELYYAQRKYEEAEVLYLRALAICEQELGAMHPDTATILNNLAKLYQAQGRYGEAEPLLKRSLAIREQQLRANHPDITESLNNLGELYQVQGRDEEAEWLYVRALLIDEQDLGASHLGTATILNNLAGLYRAQGRYEEAELLLKRLLEIDTKTYGAKCPAVATDLNNLALLYNNQGRYGEAEGLYRRALLIYEQDLGASHLGTATCLSNLAGLYYTQGRYREAEPLCQHALVIYEQQLGSEHPNTRTVREYYASLLRAMEENS